uniref:Uncharacterized protein n=1 Tax=Physcomitrium patens TaxID=3218 RepID=A0A7I4EWW9_PHYPA
MRFYNLFIKFMFAVNGSNYNRVVLCNLSQGTMVFRIQSKNYCTKLELSSLFSFFFL